MRVFKIAARDEARAAITTLDWNQFVNFQQEQVNNNMYRVTDPENEIGNNENHTERSWIVKQFLL